jgi:hypothetical protein
VSTDENSALSNEDEDIDPALDALDEGFIDTAAPVCSQQQQPSID